jgi:hypothetical protein
MRLMFDVKHAFSNSHTTANTQTDKKTSQWSNDEKIDKKPISFNAQTPKEHRTFERMKYKTFKRMKRARCAIKKDKINIKHRHPS